MTGLYPLRLRPHFEPKMWGSSDLSPFFEPPPERTGEVWFSFEENVVENGPLAGSSVGGLMERFGTALMGSEFRPLPYRRRSAGAGGELEPEESRPYFPILSKLLFVTEKLSVQVHPNDEYALAHEGGPGKTEMWYVVTAEPSARVALGLTENLDREELEAAARSGKIEAYLNWVPVKQDDVIFVPAGLLHTLGPGVTVCEIQQNSDLTYRLFDFGRLGADGQPRPLHIEQGVKALRGKPWKGLPPPVKISAEGRDHEVLLACPYFTAERVSWQGGSEYAPNPHAFELLIVLEGRGVIAGEAYRAGEAYLIPAAAQPFHLEAESPSMALRASARGLASVRSELLAAGASREAVDAVLIR